ncbi:MAG: DivIVA domain-containing protein, partial [Chlamydiales bacterium]|nr:DivIVA domain-containing protein [Chlamydiales bacterium]
METGKDRVKKICDVLRKETLEPAKKQADEILEEARRTADQIIEEARTSSKKIQEEADSEIQKQKAIFRASL